MNGNQILMQDSQIKGQLTSLRFIQENPSTVCIDAPGAGKTYFATAMGYKASKEGIKTRLGRVSDLGPKVRTSVER